MRQPMTYERAIVIGGGMTGILAAKVYQRFIIKFSLSKRTKCQTLLRTVSALLKLFIHIECYH
ncbi:hypothetical protein WKH33_16415 [Priestia sp. WB3]